MPQNKEVEKDGAVEKDGEVEKDGADEKDGATLRLPAAMWRSCEGFPVPESPGSRLALWAEER